MDFPGGSDDKESACNAGDLGSIPGWGRFPGEREGNPLQYSCLENPMNGGTWKAAVHGVTKSRTRLSDFTLSKYPAVDVTGDRSKVRCCKEQYYIGTLNVRSMNQGKLEVVRQEMARVNVDILGISELKWTGMGEFNTDDHYIYYSRQESLRRNGVAIMVNKRVRNAVLG